jgi:hypothetical protein
VLILGIIQSAITFERQVEVTSGRTRIAIGLLLFIFIVLQRLVAKLSAGGSSWLTRRRRGLEVRVN